MREFRLKWFKPCAERSSFISFSVLSASFAGSDMLVTLDRNKVKALKEVLSDCRSL